MYSSTNCDDITTGLKIIHDFYASATDEYLNDNELAILRGSLENLTYGDMQQKYVNLKFYALKYVSRNLAYDLWGKLTLAAQSSSYFADDYRVSKKKVWHLVDRLNQLDGNSQSIYIPATTMEGEVLRDRYEIESHLFDLDEGERQYVALDRYLANKPCLVIQRSHQTPRVRQQFEREGKNLSAIGNHPQIPSLLAYFSEQQHLYLVYEYTSGIGLTELLAGKPWQPERVKSLLCSLLTALEFIQQHNLTHRNINPDNIIQVDDRWVLTDFATVKEVAGDRELTHSTMTRGTKGYLAPEQHTGMATFASDIYSIGMVGVQALTGIHPRKLRKYDPQTGNKIWREGIAVDQDLGDAIDRAIRYNFSDRYQSATQMLESLKDLAVV
ncbi:MAG: serine/threonine-protein kinase [Cyanobacteria bacterium J06600_6]